jgi:hypothetical protein
MSNLGEIGCSAAGWAPMGPLATTAIRADLNLTASDHPGNIHFGFNKCSRCYGYVLDDPCGVLTLCPPCQLAMVRNQLVRVHEAAGKKVINEINIKLEIFITLRGIFDALELDRPLLEAKVCMDCTFGSILAALLPCQLLPLRQLQLMIKRFQHTKARSSVG